MAFIPSMHSCNFKNKREPKKCVTQSIKSILHKKKNSQAFTFCHSCFCIELYVEINLEQLLKIGGRALSFFP